MRRNCWNPLIKQRLGRWLPPKNWATFFDPATDEDFKAEHPVGYWFLVGFGIIMLVLPMAIFGHLYYASHNDPNDSFMLGLIGSFLIGCGLFNYVAIIIDQFLGHLVSILSFLIGGILVAINLHLL